LKRIGVEGKAWHCQIGNSKMLSLPCCIGLV
jgi:hypothetical protein